MRQGTIVTVPPVGHPLSVEQAKQQLKIVPEYTADDTEISGFCAAAHRKIERELGYPILRQTRATHLFGFPCGPIWFAGGVNPEITSIQYRDSANALQTLDPAAYALDAVSLPAQVYRAPATTWPATVSVPGAVIVTWQGGWANAADVPDDLIMAMKILVAHWDQNREAVVDGGTPAEVQTVIDDLLFQFRVNFIV
jgi:uncharacterized phiE125 gp8 family phage protein